MHEHPTLPRTPENTVLSLEGLLFPPEGYYVLQKVDHPGRGSGRWTSPRLVLCRADAQAPRVVESAASTASNYATYRPKKYMLSIPRNDSRRCEERDPFYAVALRPQIGYGSEQ
jgi:hypothetical protein